MPKVIVKVLERPIPGASDSKFHGYGAAGVYWANGTTEAEVTDKQLAELKACAALPAVPLAVIEVPELPAAVAAELPKPVAPEAGKKSR